MNIYYTHRGGRRGPVDSPGLARAAETGGLESTDFVLLDDASDWVRASTVVGLASSEAWNPRRVLAAVGREAWESARELSAQLRRFGECLFSTMAGVSLRRARRESGVKLGAALHSRRLGEPALHREIARLDATAGDGGNRHVAPERDALLLRLAETFVESGTSIPEADAAIREWSEANRRLLEHGRRHAGLRHALIPADGRSRARVLLPVLAITLGAAWWATPTADHEGAPVPTNSEPSQGRPASNLARTDFGYDAPNLDRVARKPLPGTGSRLTPKPGPSPGLPPEVAHAAAVEPPVAPARETLPSTEPGPHRGTDADPGPTPGARAASAFHGEVLLVRYLKAPSQTFVLEAVDRDDRAELVGVVWDLASNRTVWSTPAMGLRPPRDGGDLVMGDWLSGFGMSPDGARVAVLDGQDGVLRVVDLNRRTMKSVQAHRRFDWDPVGGQAIMARAGLAQVFETRSTGNQLPAPTPYRVVFSEDGKFVVTWSATDGIVRLWDAEKAEAVHEPIEPERSPFWVPLFNGSQASSLVVGSLADGGGTSALSVKRLDISRRAREVSQFLTKQGMIRVLPGGTTVVAPTEHGIGVVDLASGKTIRTLVPPPEQGRTYDCALSPDGTLLADRRGDRLSVREVRTGKMLGVVAGSIGTIWNGEGYQPRPTFPFEIPVPGTHGLGWTCFSADWKRVAVGAFDDAKQLTPQLIAHVHDVASGERVAQYRVPREGPLGGLLPFRPEDPVLLSWSCSADDDRQVTSYRSWKAIEARRKP